MRRLRKILIGLIVVLIAAVGLLWFFWWYQISPLETLQSSKSVETAVSNEVPVIRRMTAMNAHAMAEPVALDWAQDAQLLSASATWQTGSEILSGEGDWTLVYYSPQNETTALISAVEEGATLINIRHVEDEPQLIDLENWLVDSPLVVTQVLKEGGDEFLRSQPGAVLVLSLNMEGQGGWKGRLIHKETRRTFAVQLAADSDEIFAVQQTG